MAYALDLSRPAPARLATLKAYKHADNWRAAFKTGYVSRKCSAYNPPCSYYGETHCRWVEDVARAGLRFVGYVKDSRSCHNGYFSSEPHFGWYSDNYHDETFYPVVYQLPARNGAPRYVYGYADPCNKGAAFLSFDPCDNERDAQSWACRLTKHAAEDARECEAKDTAEQRQAEIADEIESARNDVKTLIRECRAVCPSLSDAPAVREAIRNRIRRYLDDVQSLREERDTLAADFWRAVPNGY